MDFHELVDGLERSGALLAGAFEGVTDEAMRWKPAPERWSLLEILGHLCDEEAADFSVRLRLIVESPEADWPPIDPEGWVRERQHNEGDPGELVRRFRLARAGNLLWLRGLDPAALETVHTHPRFGSMRAGDMFAAWCAHDLLHLAQVARTNLDRVRKLGKPYDTGYAG
ncbi:MAG: DinB family protein [Candidatus Krumholzibacteriia bacterium]|nr:DinB family protein [bacterium]MCB9514093.1 DinB family protein [Candidatus Latescibacterota bacterium]MCB9515683.1 DinB family protein [Candidatus Latescibacterota bacterium]